MTDTITITRSEFIAYQAAVELATKETRNLAASHAAIEADNAALIEVARAAATVLFNLDQRSGFDKAPRRAIKETLAALDAALKQPHPGASFLAELEAARAVVAAARHVHRMPRSLAEAIASYDWTVQEAREE